MGAHAKFSPSGASRWIPCPGSIVLEGQLPQTRTSSIYSDEGTSAHHIAQEILSNKWSADHAQQHYSDSWWRVDADGATTIHGVKPDAKASPGNAGPITPEFIDAVMVYVNYCRDLAVEGYDTFVEQRVSLSETLGVPDQFGTSDFIAANEALRHLHVADLKFGMGNSVSAVENYQGMLYALGALSEMEVIYGKNAFDFVTIHIVQPRIDNIDQWMISIDQLKAFAKVASDAVGRALGAMLEKPEDLAQHLSPSDKACHWCKAKAMCPAIASKVSDLFIGDDTAIDLGRAPAMTPAAQGLAAAEILSRRYAAVDLVESWAAAVRDEVNRRVISGETIIGTDGLPMKVGQGKKGNRAWVGDKLAEVEGLLMGVLGDKAYEPREIISPSAAAKILDKKKTAAQWVPFTTYIHQSPGRPTVMLGSDPRPSISSVAPEASTDDFGAVADPLCD